MKRACPHNSRGFTLLELLIVLAIIGILAAVGFVVYQKNIARAMAADIIQAYDSARIRASVAVITEPVSSCGELIRQIGGQPYSQGYARMGYGFEGVNGGKDGYRPVITYARMPIVTVRLA